MAQRTFKVTLPANTTYHNLYSLLVGTAVYGSPQGGTNETGITGAIPTDGILPDRVSDLEIQAAVANGAGTLTIGDRNNANTDGPILQSGDVWRKTGGGRNVVCMKDYVIKGSANSLVFAIDMGFI